MATASNIFITPEEYLERERKAEFRNEYFRGQVVAMSGASRQHVRIVTNLIRELGQQLRQRDCNVYSTDLRVSISRASLYTYPDVVITCGEEKFLDTAFDTLLNPAVIIEVLSESTRDYDRGQKFESYRLSASLSDYLTVAQDRMHVEQWTRQADGRWMLSEHTEASSRIHIQLIGVELPVSDIYEKVQFS